MLGATSGKVSVTPKRLAGTAHIRLPRASLDLAQRRGLRQFRARVRTCMHATTGLPTCIHLTIPLGDPAADQAIIDAVEKWRFEPIGEGLCLEYRWKWIIN